MSTDIRTINLHWHCFELDLFWLFSLVWNFIIQKIWSRNFKSPFKNQTAVIVSKKRRGPRLHKASWISTTSLHKKELTYHNKSANKISFSATNKSIYNYHLCLLTTKQLNWVQGIIWMIKTSFAYAEYIVYKDHTYTVHLAFNCQIFKHLKTHSLRSVTSNIIT